MLKLSVMGQSKLLQPFMDHFKTQPFYELKSECNQAVVEANTGLEEISTFFEFNEPSKISSKGQSFWVNLKTKNGKEIRFQLTDGSIVDMGQGTVIVYGKNYDIFACKKPPTDNK